uniref:RELT-like protein 2 n=1 Tax=Semicossyphus pulcher TaxID=241346 RepID=UPI0037E8D0BA
MTELEASGVAENPPPYMIFVVVFLFFLTGLLGFLVCHLLKKKGYRCRTGDMEEEEEEEEKLGGIPDDDDEENQDTVEQILKCIIENEANMEAFNEMIGNHNVCVRHDPRLRKESIGGVPPHHHTVHSGTDHNSCHLCAQVRSKKGRRQSRTPRSKQRPGEQTVFSVGRFRVTHTDKKLHGGPNPLVTSGDQLDQSQDSDERKEGVYNLRSMFKDVRPPSENTNGVAPNVGKRRKSLTIFGLRRTSDPVAVKAGDGTGRETGGVRFAIQQQPVVLEELLHSENIEVPSERGVKPGIKPEPSKNLMPASPQRVAKTSGSVVSPSSLSKNQDHNSSTAPKDGSKHGPSPESGMNLGIKSGSVASVRSLTKGDSVSSPLSMKEQEIEGARIPRTEEKTGILKAAKPSPVEGYSKEPAHFPPSDQLSEDRPSSLLLSPSSPVSSSPIGSRISSVTIVKARPDSKREFSVVTMAKKEESSTSTKDQGGGPSETGVEPEKQKISPAVDREREVYISGVGQPEKQSGETSGAEEMLAVSQEKDDMVEMEDIRDCKVTQEQEVQSAEEKMLNIGSKQD